MKFYFMIISKWWSHRKWKLTWKLLI